MLMLKKNLVFKWNLEGKLSFEQIKEAISTTPVFANPKFSNNFLLYIYSGQHSIASVLTQKDEEASRENPITFHSKTLRGYEPMYNFV